MQTQIVKDFPNAVYFSFPKITTYIETEGKNIGKVQKKMCTYDLKWGDIDKTTIVKGHKAFAFKTGSISGISPTVTGKDAPGHPFFTPFSNDNNWGKYE